MADATLKKTEVMVDQALFMLMTHSTDGIISEMDEEYFRLKQAEEVLKIRKRLAGPNEAEVRPPPSPIPVETAKQLQRRLAEALGASPPRNSPRHAARQLHEGYVLQNFYAFALLTSSLAFVSLLPFMHVLLSEKLKMLLHWLFFASVVDGHCMLSITVDADFW